MAVKRSKWGVRLRAAAAKIPCSCLSQPGKPSLASILAELKVRQSKLQMQIDQLRGAHLSLSQSHERYVDLYEQAPVAYLTLTAGALISKANPAAALLLGEEQDALLQRPFERFIFPEDLPAFRETLGQVVEQGQRQSCALALRRSNGSALHAQLDCMLQRRGETTIIGLALTDLTERKQAEAEIASLAFFDPLTRLPNRRLLLDRLLQAAHASHRNFTHGAVLSLDLDSFKLLNDTQGHDAGDRLLQQAARRLTGCVREMDTVGRLGGDEFVVLLEDLSSNAARAATQAKQVGEKILAALGAPYLLANQEHRTSGSMGITLFSNVRESVEEILKRADLALYHAKAAGGGALRFFDPELEAAVKARTTLEAELRAGIKQGQFLLLYQPQVDLQGRMTGAEALLRWQHPTRGLLDPADFIGLAEEKGLIVALGKLVLRAACKQLAAWRAAPATAHLTLSVNMCAAEFYHPDMVANTLRVLERERILPESLYLEITESLMMRNIDETIAKMNYLRDFGVCLSLDDFGMGFSSLAYLKSLPLCQLKIDASFVRDVERNPSSAAIVRTIITLGESLGLRVIAEGVETPAQRDFLAALGCRAFQGFLFGRPVPAGELELLVDRSAEDAERVAQQPG